MHNSYGKQFLPKFRSCAISDGMNPLNPKPPFSKMK